MAITYPLALPGDQIRKLTPHMRSVVALSESPFTFEQQTYVHQGQGWMFDVELAPMERDDAEEWLGWLGALNGREGTFLIGDPRGGIARGTWSGGAPVLNGSHAARVSTLQIRGVDGLGWARGDWLQFGANEGSRLHKVSQAGAQVGSPSIGVVEIWPKLRTSYLDGQAITLVAPKGCFRMMQNDLAWTIQELEYGVSFSCVEAQ